MIFWVSFFTISTFRERGMTRSGANDCFTRCARRVNKGKGASEKAGRYFRISMIFFLFSN